MRDKEAKTMSTTEVNKILVQKDHTIATVHLKDLSKTQFAIANQKEPNGCNENAIPCHTQMTTGKQLGHKCMHTLVLLDIECEGE